MFFDVVEFLGHQFFEDFHLAIEIVIEGAFGFMRAFGDVVHRGLLVTELFKQVARHFENASFGFIPRFHFLIVLYQNRFSVQNYNIILNERIFFEKKLNGQKY